MFSSYHPHEPFSHGDVGVRTGNVSVPVPDGTTTLYVGAAPLPVQGARRAPPAPELGAGCHLLSPAPERAAHPDEMLLGVCSSAPVVVDDETRAGAPGHGDPWPACSALPGLRP